MNKVPPTVQSCRSPWAAATFSLIMPGLGHVYAGALAQGLAWMFFWGIVCVVGLLFLSFPSAYSWTLGCGAELCGVVIWLAAAFHCRRIALRCKSDYELKDYNRWYVYVLLFLIGTGGCLAYALHVREQLVQPFIIPTAAMYPSILPKDRLIAVKNAYRTADPQRGDIVLFVYPEDRRLFYIKRVVALAGDTVEVKSGNLYLNGAEVSREPIGPATMISSNTAFTGQVFYENNSGAKYRIFISQKKPAA